MLFSLDARKMNKGRPFTKNKSVMAGENGVGMLTGVESSSTIEAPATGQMNVQARVYYESDRERRNIACGVKAGVTSCAQLSAGQVRVCTAKDAQSWRRRRGAVSVQASVSVIARGEGAARQQEQEGARCQPARWVQQEVIGRRERHDCARLFVGGAKVIMAAAWEEAVESIDCAGCAQKHGMSV